MVKPTADTRKPYSGATRSLVIALDVGTTFSGVSYAILEPGEVPKIHGVTRFPGQEHVAGNSKIPSAMYYDKYGKMVAAGAEAESASVLSQAEDDGWIKTELFKLRMRPKTMKLKMNGMRLSTLPRRKTAVDVFGDFLSYLFHCTRNFITDTHANGPALWHAVEHDIQFVLSHPNGWEGAQQTKMRRAAVYGGLIPDTDEGKSRIRFVTEGEASLHACVLNGLAADVLSNASKHGFLVADAGGGTLDISSYAIRGTLPLVIEEIAPPDCVFAGSVFVSRRARAFLEEKLKNSKYGTPDSLDHITKRFDETTKRLFRDKKDLQFIPFGSPLDKDITVGIRGGQLKLTGIEVAELFEPSIEAAVASIRAQIEASHGVVKSVWLVGGFAASPWLFSQLQERLALLQVTVSRPDTQTSKAVADGAIGFYCDHHVSARMSRFMYGVEYLREYDQQDEEHVARKERLCELPSGPKLLPDAFDCILARSVRVKESTVFTRKYCTELTNLSMLSVFEVEIWCYRGGDVVPKWILRQAEEFSTLCVVRADLSPLSGSAQPKKGRNGKTYWTIVFSVEIHFGLTEFKARIKWVDNGNTKYGPASIVYNESGHRADEDEPDSAPEDDNVTITSSRSDKARSEPASRARSRDSATYSSRAPSVIDFPKPETPSFLEVPDVDALRAAERERERRKSKSTSPSYASSSVEPERERIGREMDRDRDISAPRSRDKGKEKERSSRSSGHSPGSEEPSDATSGSSLSKAKLAETLTSIWGAVTSPLASTVSPPAASPSVASPTAASPSVTSTVVEKAIESASVKGKSPEKTPPASAAPVTPAAATPAPKTPAAATPVSKTPASKTPVSKTPAAKTPVSKTPAAKTPASKTPASKTSARTPAKTPARSPAKSPAQTPREVEPTADPSVEPWQMSTESAALEASSSQVEAPAATPDLSTAAGESPTAEASKSDGTADVKSEETPAVAEEEQTNGGNTNSTAPPANDHTSPVVPESAPPTSAVDPPKLEKKAETETNGDATVTETPALAAIDESPASAENVEKSITGLPKEGDTSPAGVSLWSPILTETSPDAAFGPSDTNVTVETEQATDANNASASSLGLLTSPTPEAGSSGLFGDSTSPWGASSQSLAADVLAAPMSTISPKPPASPLSPTEETDKGEGLASAIAAEKSSDETGKEEPQTPKTPVKPAANPATGNPSGVGKKGKKNKKKNKKKGAENEDEENALNEVGDDTTAQPETDGA